MKKFVSTIVLAMALLLVGCGDSHDAVAADKVALMKEFTTILESVKDVPTANAAAPKLESLASRAESIKKRLDVLGEPTAEQEKELEAKYEKQMMEVVSKGMDAMMEAGRNQEVRKILDDPIRKLQANIDH